MHRRRSGVPLTGYRWCPGYCGGMTYFPEYSPTGWLACYGESMKDSSDVRIVESWNAHGEALVVDAGRGLLVPACSLPNFLRLESTARVIAVIPSPPGWHQRVWGIRNDDSSTFDESIVAWLVDSVGNLTPVGGLNSSKEPGDSYLSPVDSRRQEVAIIAPACD